ncbi:lipid A biosynthesis lauroyl acyltransferase [Nitrococcus mobilis Nb-231]|uniref:Lipid A biosynthesis lauroyl acyltransferase n=2 Tax=Nitrococcus mobilis TaxID=35797 RepID=A4BVL0_9GAMM|nr:lipid A biosynthesis lauroyl acyltransferase [Nitrococcus mobilis Nb-231]
MARHDPNNEEDTMSQTARTLTFLWKDINSGAAGCPALYRTNGGYVVQGVQLTEDERAQLRQLADGEDAVFVPANVLDRLTGSDV